MSAFLKVHKVQIGDCWERTKHISNRLYLDNGENIEKQSYIQPESRMHVKRVVIHSGRIIKLNYMTIHFAFISKQHYVFSSKL